MSFVVIGKKIDRVKMVGRYFICEHGIGLVKRNGKPILTVNMPVELTGN